MSFRLSLAFAAITIIASGSEAAQPHVCATIVAGNQQGLTGRDYQLLKTLFAWKEKRENPTFSGLATNTVIYQEMIDKSSLPIPVQITNGAAQLVVYLGGRIAQEGWSIEGCSTVESLGFNIPASHIEVHFAPDSEFYDLHSRVYITASWENIRTHIKDIVSLAKLNEASRAKIYFGDNSDRADKFIIAFMDPKKAEIFAAQMKDVFDRENIRGETITATASLDTRDDSPIPYNHFPYELIRRYIEVSASETPWTWRDLVATRIAEGLKKYSTVFNPNHRLTLVKQYLFSKGIDPRTWLPRQR